jgi:hypothetical protein
MLLPIHIAAGLTALASGAVALCAAKGGKLHRTSGTAFVVAMSAMSATGAALAASHGQRFNLAQGVLTFYLVTTAWLAARPAIGWRRPLAVAAMLVASGVALYDIRLGSEALASPRGMIDGAPAAFIAFFGLVAAIAAIGDLRLAVSGRLENAARLARHLWRMCFAMFIATGSFFLGQARVIPEPIRIYPLLTVAALLPLVLLLYWLKRTLRRRAPGAQASGGFAERAAIATSHARNAATFGSSRYESGHTK